LAKECSVAQFREFAFKGPRGVGEKCVLSLQVGAWIPEVRMGQRAQERIPSKERIMRCAVPFLSAKMKKVGVNLHRTVENRGFWV
jgi:hypothetical protein